MECYTYLRNIQDLLSDGKTPRFPFLLRFFCVCSGPHFLWFRFFTGSDHCGPPDVDVHIYSAVKALSIVAAGDSAFAYSTLNLWCGLGVSDPVEVN